MSPQSDHEQDTITIKPTPPELRSILEQDTNADSDPSPLAEMIEEDAIEDFDPKPPILEDQ